jgi:dTDP-4-dehydrorhamnose reductase
MPRILVVGRTGQLGTALAEALPATSWPHSLMEAPELDLTDPASIAAAVAATRPELVINAAAYTAVDAAENNADLAHAINAIGPGLLAQAAASAGAAIIHISTDYVFDGSQGPWREHDAPAPLGVYGATKLAGEEAVAAANTRHAIIRTAWVCSATGHNFLKTMLRLGETRDELRVVADQQGAPTFADDLAEAIIAMAPRVVAGEGTGLFHLTGAPATTWHGFAEAIFAEAARHGRKAPVVHPITTAEYPTPARRPADSRLDCGRITELHGVQPADWRQSLARTVARLLAQG